MNESGRFGEGDPCGCSPSASRPQPLSMAVHADVQPGPAHRRPVLSCVSINYVRHFRPLSRIYDRYPRLSNPLKVLLAVPKACHACKLPSRLRSPSQLSPGSSADWANYSAQQLALVIAVQRSALSYSTHLRGLYARLISRPRCSTVSISCDSRSFVDVSSSGGLGRQVVM